MGSIVQENQDISIIPIESKLLRVTNWKIIIPTVDGMFIYVDDSVFFVHGLTLEAFNDINANNKKETYTFEYKTALLRCEKCGGFGKVDWVDKATRRKERVVINQYGVKVKYIRDKKSPITVLNFHGREAFASMAKIKTGDEHCYECHGCGVQLNNFRKFDTTSFDAC